MSVRVYRVNKIVLKDSPSFNAWHHEIVMRWLEENTNFYESLNYDGCGFTELSVEDLRGLVTYLETFSGEDGVDWVLERLKDDIKFAEERGMDWVFYKLF